MSIADQLATVTVPDLERDPYPLYARMRAQAPVAYVPAVDLWLVTRFKDVEYVGTHPGEFTAELADSPLSAAFGSPTILTVDGEQHDDLRRSLDTKYRPRSVNAYLDDLVTPIVDRQLERLAGRPAADLLAEYFEPVSVLSLGTVLGLGQFDADTLRRWFYGLREGAINFERDQHRQEVNDRTAAEIEQALAPLFAKLAETPNDSTLAHMLHSGRPEGERREPDYILPTLKVILLGGMQEPGHGAATATYGVLSDPAQLAELRADPAQWVPAAVEEGLRWVSPIGTQTRQAVTDIDLGGTTIPAGARVGAVVASANRDESVFDTDPSVFSIHRKRKSHVAFGFGIHFCAGHAFARGQMRIAITRLLAAFPQLRLDPAHPTQFHGWEFRAPGSLHVLLD